MTHHTLFLNQGCPIFVPEDRELLMNLHHRLLEDLDNLWAAYDAILKIRHNYLHIEKRNYLETMSSGNVIMLMLLEGVFGRHEITRNGVLEPGANHIRYFYMQEEWHYLTDAMNFYDEVGARGSCLTAEDVEAFDMIRSQYPGPYDSWVVWEYFFQKNVTELRKRTKPISPIFRVSPFRKYPYN
jgi:hypothetical protein